MENYKPVDSATEERVGRVIETLRIAANEQGTTVWGILGGEESHGHVDLTTAEITGTDREKQLAEFRFRLAEVLSQEALRQQGIERPPTASIDSE